MSKEIRNFAICKEDLINTNGFIYFLCGKKYQYEIDYSSNEDAILYKIYYDGKKFIDLYRNEFDNHFMNVEEAREFQLNQIL